MQIDSTERLSGDGGSERVCVVRGQSGRRERGRERGRCSKGAEW